MYDEQLRSRRYYERRARWYDRANRVAAWLRGTSPRRERLHAIERLGLRPHDRVLEVSCGTGTNLALMCERAPSLRLVGLDLSRGMLALAAEKLRGGRAASLIEGEASRLPFRDHVFDAVFHHGGFAEFGDKPGAIREMARVARPGARIVICDVGVPTDRRLSLINRLLLLTQPIYRQPPPLDLLPATAHDIGLSWIGGGAWYVIEFSNSGAGD